VVTPPTIVVKQKTEVMVTSHVSGDAAHPLLPTSVELFRVVGHERREEEHEGREKSEERTLLGLMHDDGKAGDAVAGDGVFTLRFTTTEKHVGELRVQVSAAFKRLVRRVHSQG
jgi:hypothetical protein